MTPSFNRQTRRASLCMGSRRPLGLAVTTQAGWEVVTADRDSLAQVAARIAAELELSADAIDELLWGPAGPMDAASRN